jgi:hypothetical protein
LLTINKTSEKIRKEGRVNKRDKQTVVIPDRDAVQRQRKERCAPPLEAEQDECVAGRDQFVPTMVTQREHDANQEATKSTCLYFGSDRHSTWKAYGAMFCNQCDQYDSLAPEKKTNKRRSTKKFWCTVSGNKDGVSTKNESSWLAMHYKLNPPIMMIVRKDNHGRHCPR